MARKYLTHIREEKAVEFRVTVDGLEAYKEAWLIISNNARCYPDSFYQVRNNDHDDIYVMSNPKSAKEAESFLSQFGEITRNDDKYVVFVDVECDYSDFDKDYIDSEYVIGETD